MTRVVFESMFISIIGGDACIGSALTAGHFFQEPKK
jgi:hypothetical protein